MKNFVQPLIGSLFFSSVFFQLAPPAAAQTAKDVSPARDPGTTTSAVGFDSEIVVTARKRQESLQEVPLSVTAFNEATISRNNITRIDQVTQYSPNVVLVPISISSTSAIVFIRGIGNYIQEPSNDSPVAVSVDGVYTTQIAGSLIDVFDVAQIEILRGPQGSLQGRNSPGGAVNITTKRPSMEFGARAEASYGNYNDIQLKAGIDIPIVSDKVAVKVAGFLANRDGYVKNITTGNRLSDQDTIAARAGILFTPTDNLNIYVTGDYTRDKSQAVGWRFKGAVSRSSVVCVTYGYCSNLPRRQSFGNYDRPNDVEIWGVTGNADWTFGDVTLTSVTGYRKVHDIQNQDLDATPASHLHLEGRNLHTKQFSQELRLSSSGSGRARAGVLDWVLGLYYLNGKFDLVQRQRVFTGALSVGRRDQTLKSYAVFGQASYHITDAWSISVGARQSWDDKVLHAKPNGVPNYATIKADFKNLSVEAGTEYRFSDDAMAYFRFSQGYRAGGINGSAATVAAVTSYGPEKVNAYEVGLKSEWMDRQLTANVTAFWYDYKDAQRGVIVTPCVGCALATVIGNEGAAHLYGVEAEIVARPTEWFSVNINYGYLNGKYLDAIFRGRQLHYSPKHSVTVGFDWLTRFDGSGSVTVTGDVNYKSQFNANVASVPIGEQEGYAVVNGAITYHTEDERYSIGLYGRNLLNAYYITAGETSGNTAPFVVEGVPRTYGVRATAKF